MSAFPHPARFVGNVQTRSCEFDIVLRGEMIQFDLHMFFQIWLNNRTSSYDFDSFFSQKKNRWNIPDFEDRHSGGRLGM